MMNTKAAIKEPEPDLLGTPPKKALRHPHKPPVKPKAKSTALATAQAKPPAQHVVTASESLLAVVMAAVRDPACDTAKMRQILDMKRELEQEDAKKAFTLAFIALQADLAGTPIRPDRDIEVRAKDATGQRNGRILQKTPYATFQNIMRVVGPHLRTHGFTLAFSTEPTADGTRINVIGVLRHSAGHSERTIFPLPAETSGSKNNVQGWGSSFSYGKRYAAIALLNLVSDAEQDRDNEGAEIAEESEAARLTDEQVEELTAKIEASKVGLQRFCEKYKIQSVADLPVAQFDAAVSACEAFAAKSNKADGGR